MHKYIFTVLFFFLLGCSSGEIGLVQNGTLKAYPQTSIGKAFESYFTDTKWQKIELKNGAIVVQFNGKTSNYKVASSLDLGKTVEVEIQFLLNLDGKGFQTSYGTIVLEPRTKKGRDQCVALVNYGMALEYEKKGLYMLPSNMKLINLLLETIYNGSPLEF